MKQLLSLLLVISVHVMPAQDTMTCLQQLDTVIDAVSRNYAGFHDKVTPSTRTTYGALLDSLRTGARTAPDGPACFALLDRYINFFRDKHLILNGRYKATNEPEILDAPPVTTRWTAATLHAYFDRTGATSLPLEGIWTLQGYEVGIVHNDTARRYEGIVITSANANWKEGMLKFTFSGSVNGHGTARYWRGDLQAVDVDAFWAMDHLSFSGIGIFDKKDPEAQLSMDRGAFLLEHGSEVQWRMLDDSTLYIKLGSCNLSNKATLDSLLEVNASELRRIPQWIVDFRGNRGGSTDVFTGLLPYLYTKPLVDAGQSHWMSPANTTRLARFVEQNHSMMDEGSRIVMEEIVTHGKAHPNTWHIQPADTLWFDSVLAMPRRVAVLADRNTASSGESFLLSAHLMSDKAVIFGEPTGGYLDYGDLMRHELGPDGLSLDIPSSRMSRVDQGLRYDITGFPPDVPMPSGTTDPIAFVRQWWSTH